MESQSVKEIFVLLTFLVNISLLIISTCAHAPGQSAQHLQKLVALAQPEQIHLSFGATAQDATIMWATKRDAGPMYVEVAESVQALKTVEAERFTLDESSQQAARFLYRAVLTALTPGEKYVYRVVGRTGANSNLFSFTVPQLAGRKGVNTFLVMSDLGLASESLQFLTYEASSHEGLYRAVLHLGDIAHNLHHNQGDFGDRFLNHVQKFAAKLPYMTLPGDQERFHKYAHYRARFSMPGQPWPMQQAALWWSVDVGLVHFVALNTEVFHSLPAQRDAQLTWLRDDLRAANQARQLHPWVIVLGHRPLYCSPTSHSHADLDPDPDPGGCEDYANCSVRLGLEDILFEEGADLYLSGHQHNYERSWPLYRGKVFQQGYRDPLAPVHIHNGALGYAYHTAPIPSPAPWSAFSVSDGRRELYGRLEVLNETHLMWDAYVATNGNEHVDSLLLIQHRHGPFGKAGDEAYRRLIRLQQLPPAPFHWQPPAEPRSGAVFDVLLELPPSTRRLYLLTLCGSLLALVTCLLCMPRVRNRVCRWSRS